MCTYIRGVRAPSAWRASRLAYFAALYRTVSFTVPVGLRSPWPCGSTLTLRQALVETNSWLSIAALSLQILFGCHISQASHYVAKLRLDHRLGIEKLNGRDSSFQKRRWSDKNKAGARPIWRTYVACESKPERRRV